MHDQERALWIATIQQALVDLVGRSERKGLEKKEDERSASRWLFHPLIEEDLEKVCELAGVSHDAIRRIARHLRQETKKASTRYARTRLLAVACLGVSRLSDGR